MLQPRTYGHQGIISPPPLSPPPLPRLGEDFGIVCTFHPKPVKNGDWNGTGAHTNYSTKAMREPGGMEVILAAVDRLSKCHPEHISQVHGCGVGRKSAVRGG